jgi:hypothetical protein
MAEFLIWTNHDVELNVVICKQHLY